MTQDRRDLVTVRIPPELADRIDDYLKANIWGYRSRAEIVAVALRAWLQEVSQTAEGQPSPPPPDPKKDIRYRQASADDERS